MTVYKILKTYKGNDIEYSVMPYDLNGSIAAGMPKKPCWWYRSEKKANAKCAKMNKRIKLRNYPFPSCKIVL